MKIMKNKRKGRRNKMGTEKETEEKVQEESVEKAENESQEELKEKKADDEKKPEKSEEEKLKEQLAESQDKYLRLMAEYDNFRKRSAKERLEVTSTATANAVKEILSVIDNFERALETETQDESYKAGIEMIFNQFLESLKKLNVEPIDPTGETFDPNIANAVNQIEDPELGENVVAQTFQKGYKIGDKVIRYAMVVVANP